MGDLTPEQKWTQEQALLRSANEACEKRCSDLPNEACGKRCSADSRVDILRVGTPVGVGGEAVLGGNEDAVARGTACRPSL